jgi:long-chain acyl-CoA synthetase
LGLAGKRVAVIGENRYEWCLAHVAVTNGLGVSVPLDRMLPEGEVLGLLERGEASAVVYSPAFQKTMEAAAESLASVRFFICMDAAKVKDPRVPFTPAGRFQDLAPIVSTGRTLLLGGDRAYLDAPIDSDVLSSLLFTSGTTSASKAVMLSHHNVCADIRGMCSMLELRPGHRMLSVLPLHHTFENTCGLMTALAIGACIYECDGLRHIQKNMQEFGISLIIGVPVLFENFYTKVQETLKKTKKETFVRVAIGVSNFLRIFGLDLRRKLFSKIHDAFGGRLSIGICGAAPIDPAIIRFFSDIGIMIYQGYGLTETAPVVTGCNSRIFYPGTVGHPVGGVDIAVDSEVRGAPGEILVRGPIVMLGYYKDEKATAEVLHDGWFHTGDIGTLDRKERLTVTGRLKSMIVLPNGKKIFPEEIEQLIGHHSSLVKETMVWGELVRDGDVEVCARFVLNKEELLKLIGETLDDLEIRRTLENLVKEINARMPSFKAIRYFVFGFEEMVKTTTLKIKRPVEITRIHDLMAAASLQLREITGRNIDPLMDASGL